MTISLIQQLNDAIEHSRGKITIASIARDIGKPYAQVEEWLSGRRSKPNHDNTQLLSDWSARNGKLGGRPRKKGTK